MAKGMAGTRLAALRCGECGHARIRHTRGGTGPCSEHNWLPSLTLDGLPTVSPSRCLCTDFTLPKEGNV